MTDLAKSLACIVSAAALLVASLSPLAQTPSNSGVTAIRAGKMFDAKAGKMVENQVILVHDDQIQQVGSTLREVSDAARSLRVLADYLERHPEALLRGKKGEAE